VAQYTYFNPIRIINCGNTTTTDAAMLLTTEQMLSVSFVDTMGLGRFSSNHLGFAVLPITSFFAVVMLA